MKRTNLAKRNDWTLANVVAKRVIVRGCNVPWSQMRPANTLPTVLEIPVKIVLLIGKVVPMQYAEHFNV